MKNRRYITYALGIVAVVGGLSWTQFVCADDVIKVDGSSTVYPITEAVAEDFQSHNSSVKVTVGISGTGGGFKKFCAGETDISNASRPIKATEEELCKAKGVEYIELPVAYDALTIVVNPKNTWLSTITVSDLKKMWEPDAQGKVTSWNQIRPEWPNQPIKLFGPGVDSGTFDYFTDAIMGKEKASRGDYTSSEDDNMLVQGVANDVNALGYFGLAYYEENAKRLKAIPVDGERGKGAQKASRETVINGSYQPLSRPLFIYVRKDSLQRKELVDFVNYYIKNAATLVSEVGYVGLPNTVYTLAQARFDKRKVGSALGAHGSQVAVSLEELLSKG